MSRYFPTFGGAINYWGDSLKEWGEDVDSGHWQGVPTEGKPDLQTREILDVAFSCPTIDQRIRDKPPTQDLLALLRHQIRPNLPWADLQFEERISRNPQNPDPSYAQWPWASSGSDKALTHTKPDISEQSWSYLAGLIDGEGYINLVYPTRPRIVISQKDREFLQEVVDVFAVGKTTVRFPNPNTHPKGSVLRWTIAERGQVKWVLTKVLPYLRLKHDKAASALETIGGPATFPKGKAKFTHTYSERMWPSGWGIRYPFCNLDDVVDLLLKNPYTRQAYLPMFGFEDTGAKIGRVPCSLGWHFMLRNNQLNIWYMIRSCDFIRHFRDDLYLAARLLLWVLDELQRRDHEVGSIVDWDEVNPGDFHFHCFSLHYHRGDEHLLKEVTK